jgi:glutamine amidotransferase
MAEAKKPSVAIVDYGVGNLFSVKQACESAGMQATITSSQREILSADAVILPGVGAYSSAMDMLRRLDLVTVLQDVASSQKPLAGICLGMQLLMTESHEFGLHKGLGIIAGPVLHLDNLSVGTRKPKVPQVGWNRIYKPQRADAPAEARDFWAHTPLEGLSDGEFMYFVHSFYVRPEDSSVVLSSSRYGDAEFCSSLHQRNIFACQFHPERSGPQGLKIYSNLRARIRGDGE